MKIKMKRPKTKTTTQECLIGSKAEEKPAASKVPWDEMGDLPTTETLFNGMIMLAKDASDSPSLLAEKAWTYWLAARYRIFRAGCNDEIGGQDSSFQALFGDNEAAVEEEYFPPLPPDEYPVTRDRFLLLMLPQYTSRTADLGRTAKAFVRDTLREKYQREPTQDEIDSAYARWKPLEKPGQANAQARRFQLWYQKHISGFRRAAGLKSAASKKLKKTL